VVGQTGTGKSSLLRDITGQDITIGETHKSGLLITGPWTRDGEKKS
jgi:ABC-type phosphate/phosphonate transport system ATPase subunit